MQGGHGNVAAKVFLPGCDTGNHDAEPAQQRFLQKILHDDSYFRCTLLQSTKACAAFPVWNMRQETTQPGLARAVAMLRPYPEGKVRAQTANGAGMQYFKLSCSFCT